MASDPDPSVANGGGLPRPDCAPVEHGGAAPPPRSAETYDRAVSLFKALADPARLELLERLTLGATCVSELAAATSESMSSVSHRLRLLRGERLVAGERRGRHVYYRIVDRHVLDLVRNALDHVTEDHHGA